ncbi:hypothetical protein QWY22_13945 [Planococcus liqunii]|nr:hypothetical protein [Planococcus sp. N056]WKA49995.1 hypothetical protein QWY22_13945 [Planococcus sp. N056]
MKSKNQGAAFVACLAMACAETAGIGKPRNIGGALMRVWVYIRTTKR